MAKRPKRVEMDKNYPTDKQKGKKKISKKKGC